MNYLKDTCVFIDRLNAAEAISGTAFHCKMRGDYIAISKQVLDELYPGNKLDEEQRLKGKDLYDTVSGAVEKELIKFIEIEKNKETNNRFKDIRKRFYGWMSNPAYINSLVANGTITREEAMNKSFRHKDVGECSLLAIAMGDPNQYVIITEDKGRVYTQPHINLFKEYAIPNNIKVWSYSEWADNVQYET